METKQEMETEFKSLQEINDALVRMLPEARARAVGWIQMRVELLNQRPSEKAADLEARLGRLENEKEKVQAQLNELLKQL